MTFLRKRFLAAAVLVLLTTLVAGVATGWGSKSRHQPLRSTLTGPTKPLTFTQGAAADRSARRAAAVIARKRKQPKGLTKAKIVKLIKKEIRRAKGPAGPSGPTGPSGPVGPVGPVGAAAEGTPTRKLSYTKNSGSPLEVPFSGAGMALEAECAATFTLRFRATEKNGVVTAAASGAGGTYFAGGVADLNDTIDLVPGGEQFVSGKLEYSQFGTGATVTVNYQAAFGTSQGDCVFTGTIVQG